WQCCIAPAAARRSCLGHFRCLRHAGPPAASGRSRARLRATDAFPGSRPGLAAASRFATPALPHAGTGFRNRRPVTETRRRVCVAANWPQVAARRRDRYARAPDNRAGTTPPRNTCLAVRYRRYSLGDHIWQCPWRVSWRSIDRLRHGIRCDRSAEDGRRAVGILDTTVAHQCGRTIQKPRCMAGFLYEKLVAGAGFEPTTFGL